MTSVVNPDAGGSKYDVVLVKPDGFEYVEGFRETMETLCEALIVLGHRTSIHTNSIDTDAIPIIFGAHHLSPDGTLHLPANAILYNLEQLRPGYPWYQPYYLDLLRRFQVWDYSAQNVAYLQQSGIAPRALHVPLGYMPGLSRIVTAPLQDIDVLFYGVQTPRRLTLLNLLGEAGLKVVALLNVWGAERDAWIARSKLVLNVHQAEGGVLEMPRIMFLLANRKVVVSEEVDLSAIDDRLREGIRFASYQHLVDVCCALAADSAQRALIEDAGFNVVTNPSCRMDEILSAIDWQQDW